MEQSIREMRNTNYKSISVSDLDELRKQQLLYPEGSFEYADIEAKISQIVAENYLRYVNR